MGLLASKSLDDTSETLIYRVASGLTARRLIIANRNAATVNIRIWFNGFDQIRGDEHIVGYDLRLAANASMIFPDAEVSLDDREEIWVRTDTAGVSVGVMS